MAHFQRPCDLGHWHAPFVGRTYGRIAVCPEIVGFLLKLLFAPDVILGECR